MSKLEKEYFKYFTLERLEAARKKIARDQKANHGCGYVLRIFNGKVIRINKRKIDMEIMRRKITTSENP